MAGESPGEALCGGAVGARLIGRDAELTELTAALHAGRSVVVRGPRGAGRTALARAAEQVAREAGHGVIRLSPTRAMATVPMGVVSRLLPAGTAAADAAGIATVIDALVRLRATRTNVVVADDAQWLDALTAAILLDLASAAEVLVVATIRATDVPPDGLARLWKDGVAALVDVAALDEHHVEEVVAGVLGGHLDPAVLSAAVDASAGELPGLVAQLDGWRRAGALQRREGVWRLVAGAAEPQLMAGLERSDLTPDERNVLDALGVGGAIAVEGLLALVSEDVIDALHAGGLIAIDCGPDGRLTARLRPPATPIAPPADLLARRRRLTAVATALDALAEPTEDDRLAATLLRVEAGHRLAPDDTLAVARHARRRSRPAHAATLARAAATAGAGVAAELLLASIDAAGGRAQHAEDRLVVLALAADDPADVDAIACARIDNLLNGLFRPEEAFRVASGAATALAGSGHGAGVQVRQGLLALVGGDVSGGAAFVEPAMAEASGNALVAGCWIAAYARALNGRFDGALALLDIAEATPDGGTDGDLPPWDRGTLDSLRCFALGGAGRMALAGELASTRHRAAISSGDQGAQALYAWCRGGIALTAGKAGTAQRRAAEAAAIYADLQSPTQQRLALHDLARARALLGDVAGGRAALDAASATRHAADRDLWTDSGRLRTEAWLAAADGEMAVAREHMQACLANAAACGEPINELAARHDLVRFGDTGHADALDRLVAGFEGEQPRTIARYVRGVEVGDAELLRAAVDEFESMGLLLFAAEAAAALAEVLGRTGCTRDAAAASARAASFTSACEGASTPALTVRGVLANLSPRETEVARLAARGLANREIAARMYVSVRTVESQLQRAYAKLGIRSRDQLADALDVETTTA